jgi:4-amino-4-deoxy-L-arabinose transferase-like glycosyltransferase
VSKKFIISICLILFLGAILRFYALDKGNPLSDESDYGFRSYGLLDYASQEQHTTPLVWYDPGPLPFWLRFSFHDAPPLFFLIQHFSFVVFGDNTFALRFPSAFFGLATVLLTITLGTMLYGKLAGVISGLLLAISTNSIYVSRVGLIDATVIFFIVLTIIFYRKGLQNSWYYCAMGASLGLGLLTKYTASIAFIIVAIDVVLFHRGLLRDKKFWFGLLIALCLFSPVIMYNVYLFRSFGHFDYALMNFIGPIPDIWKVNPGRDIGSMKERIIQLIPSTFSYGFWGLVLLSHLGFIYIFWQIIRKGKAAFLRHYFLIVIALLLIIFVVILGPAPRFIAMTKPFFVISGGYIISYFYQKVRARRFVVFLLCLVTIIGILYDINTFLIPRPYGKQNVAFSADYYRVMSVGYVNLEIYFKSELVNKIPQIGVKPKYSFLGDIWVKDARTKQALGYVYVPALIILDPNIYKPAALYVFGKLNVYQGWPILSIEAYLDAKSHNIIPRGTICYFAALDSHSYIGTNKGDQFSIIGPNFEQSLQLQNYIPTFIKDRSGKVAFRVYRWRDEQYQTSIQ